MNFLKNCAIIGTALLFIFFVAFVLPRVIVTDRETIIGSRIVIYHGTILDKPSSSDLMYLMNDPFVKRVRWLVPVINHASPGDYQLYEWDRDSGWIAVGGIVYID